MASAEASQMRPKVQRRARVALGRCGRESSSVRQVCPGSAPGAVVNTSELPETGINAAEAPTARFTCIAVAVCVDVTLGAAPCVVVGVLSVFVGVGVCVV